MNTSQRLQSSITSPRQRVFMFSDLTASDDDGSIDDDTRSTLLTPTALEAHAEETRRELDTHRERLKQRSVAHLEAERHRKSEESELQRTVSKLMSELAEAQDATQRESTKRAHIEKQFRLLQAEHRTVSDELAALKRKDAVQGAASPVISPASRIPGTFPHHAKPSVSFRLVKKSIAPSHQQTALSALKDSELFSRNVISDLSSLNLKALHSCWTLLKRASHQGLSVILRDLILLESSERSALAAHEAKLRYKALLRLRTFEADEFQRKYVHQRALLSQSKVDLVRKLEDEMDDSALVPPPPPVPAPKNPPWYPAGNTSINYHSPHRQRSPSATSRSATPSRLGSAGQSLTSVPNYSHILPRVESRSISPGSSRKKHYNEPSPHMSPPTPHHHPIHHYRRASTSPQVPLTRQGSPPKNDAPSLNRVVAQKHESNRKITSVKSTIDTMEALLAELQSWKTVASR